MNAMPEDRFSPAIAELKVPPHDILAEQAVLGALMLDPKALPKISDWLVEGDFYRRDHRMVYRAIAELVKRGAPVDSVTLTDWLDDAGLLGELINRAYLVEMDGATASSANIVAHAELVLEKSRLRAAIGAGEALVQGAWARGADPQQVIADASHALSQLQVSKLRGGLEPANIGMGRMHSEMLRRFDKGPSLIGTPWPWAGLNDATKGLRDGVLYVVGARPNMGKSIFGMQAAVHTALKGGKVAYFSIEMTADECMSRAVSCVGEIPHNWVENPGQEDLDSQYWWSQLNNASTLISASPLLIDETPTISIDQLMARARRAHMQSPIRLIVIDHMHDMALDPKREVRHELGRIAQGAKTLAKDLKCPVIMLAQLNRSMNTRSDKRPNLTDLRESGEIEQKADVILFLHREDYHDPNSHLKNVVEVIIGKGRNIRSGNTIHLRNVFSEMRMEDWEGPLPEQPKEEPKGKGGFK